MSNEIIKESLFGDDESASNQILETLERQNGITSITQMKR